jgi:hypothetical protein
MLLLLPARKTVMTMAVMLMLAPRKQKIAAKYAIRQQQQASNKPEYPLRIEEPAASA